jgi:tungstate transport system substrate-binding protein
MPLGLERNFRASRWKGRCLHDNLSLVVFVFKKIRSVIIIKKRSLIYVLLLLLSLSLVTACSKPAEEPAPPEVETPEVEVSEEPVVEKPADGTEIILSTTTSTQDSGLLDYLLPIFTEDTGVTVKTIAVGTGNALQMGRDGEADVLFVHAKPDELKLVEEGHGTLRHDVMYNDFVLVGPKGGDSLTKGNDIFAAFAEIQEKGLTFVSRGDDSGTHKKELKFWSELDVVPMGDWYVEAGTGMGDVLKIADEKLGYTMTDRATYLAMKDDLELEGFVEGDEALFNQYGVIPVNPDKGDMINAIGAEEFANWIISDKVQALIADFGIDKYGEGLFIPNAK